MARVVFHLWRKACGETGGSETVRKGGRSLVFPRLEHKAEDGFVAVDAMIALAILATTIVLSLAATQTARRIVGAAAEIHRADGQLRYLLDTAPRAIGSMTGQGADFAWQVITQPATGTRVGGAQICNRLAVLHSAISGRAYSMTTAEVCPAA